MHKFDAAQRDDTSRSAPFTPGMAAGDNPLNQEARDVSPVPAADMSEVESANDASPANKTDGTTEYLRRLDQNRLYRRLAHARRFLLLPLVVCDLLALMAFAAFMVSDAAGMQGAASERAKLAHPNSGGAAKPPRRALDAASAKGNLITDSPIAWFFLAGLVVAPLFLLDILEGMNEADAALRQTVKESAVRDWLDAIRQRLKPAYAAVPVIAAAQLEMANYRANYAQVAANASGHAKALADIIEGIAVYFGGAKVLNIVKYDSAGPPDSIGDGAESSGQRRSHASLLARGKGIFGGLLGKG